MSDLPLRGVRVPFAAAGTSVNAGRLAAVESIDVIDQDVQRLVMTALGSRPRREYFGTKVPDLPFENLLDALPPDVLLSVEEAFQLWESRINLKSLTARQAQQQTEGKIDLHLAYGLSSLFLREIRRYETVVTLGEPDNVF